MHMCWRDASALSRDVQEEEEGKEGVTYYEVPWGPNGQSVYERTYSRIKADGSHEAWPETVQRVVDGNLAFVDARYHEVNERDLLIEYMTKMRIIPAGRHLWMSGVPGRSFINNCFVAPWGDEHEPERHFAFVFNHLMQGGGVGSNYSNVHYPLEGNVELHLVCSPDHDDYEEIKQYLSPTYNHDCWEAIPVEDSREGWITALEQLILGHQSGVSSLVLDLSRIRKRGSRIKTFGGTAAGPEPLVRLLTNIDSILMGALYIGTKEAMKIDHEIAQCVVSGNVRRSARMSILHWKHPDINWFINCKADSGEFWTTNISVEIDDEFCRLVQDAMCADKNRTPERDQAMAVYAAMVKGMQENGEPGFWNSSLSNVGEPNLVTATNPCGEIVLPEAGVCNLGHVNLDAGMDDHELLLAHHLITRFLIRATFAPSADDQTQEVQDRDRRIGVGHFGLHGFLVKNGLTYSEAGSNGALARSLQSMAQTVARSAAMFAHKLRIPIPVKTRTVAPTGTIAKLAGRSEGIHPIFSPYFLRRIRFSDVDPRQIEQVEEYRAKGYLVEPCLYAPNTTVVTIPSKDPLVDEASDHAHLLEGSEEISLSDQLKMQRVYQDAWADNAVSYTINLSEDDSDALYDTLWMYLHCLKGTTVFPAKSRPQSPYERITKAEYEALVEALGEENVSDGVDEECSTGACPIK